jgi:hypothetical protein
MRDINFSESNLNFVKTSQNLVMKTLLLLL